MDTKAFKVAAVSSNQNSFGLTGMILISQDGEAWQVAANNLNVRRTGSVINVPIMGDRARNFGSLGFEIPQPFTTAPFGGVAEIWN